MPSATHDQAEPVPPTAEEAELAREAESRLASLLEEPGMFEVSVSTKGGRRESLFVPASSLRVLADNLLQIAAGIAAAHQPGVVSEDEAADILNVSRACLLKLLDEGELPCREVGGRRRVRLRDLLSYKNRVEQERSKALDELAAQAQELDMGY